MLIYLDSLFCSETASKDQFVRPLESEPSDKDDMVLLNEILNASSLDEGEFSKEWTAVFGQVALTDLTMNSSAGDEETTSSSMASTPSGYLPSQLLDQNMNDLQSSLHGESSSWFVRSLFLVLGFRVCLFASYKCGVVLHCVRSCRNPEVKVRCGLEKNMCICFSSPAHSVLNELV